MCCIVPEHRCYNLQLPHNQQRSEAMPYLSFSEYAPQDTAVQPGLQNEQDGRAFEL